MNFPLANCLISAPHFSGALARQMLLYNHGMTYTLVSLQKLQNEVQQFGEETFLSLYFSGPERRQLSTLRSAKRRREWLGGRFAVKCTVAQMLALDKTDAFRPNLAIIADANGRPLLVTTEKHSPAVDISISHSSDLAAAIVVTSGLCGIDIQIITDRVIKVRDRFCTPDEERLLKSFYTAASDMQRVLLTKLWAAKEALRKTANMASLPGFLELELTEIRHGVPHSASSPWLFKFLWKQSTMTGNTVTEKCAVAISLIDDYVLALTVRDDTLSAPFS